MRTLFLFVIVLLSCTNADVRNNKVAGNKKAPPGSNAVTLAEICTGIEGPIALVNAGDGSNRLFIIQQGGQIRILKDGKLMPQPFLDVSKLIDKLSPFYSEKGLLGLAFHPQYKTNGKFYIYYSAPSEVKGMDNISTLAEYKVSANPEVAEPAGKILLKIDEPEANHNGGQLAFGKDGYLYIGVGDGGGGGDKHGEYGNGQNLDVLLGKILRIDVNNDKGNGYTVPSDNPFFVKYKPEIWAYGLRNPWRFSFDRKTGELYCGDVGQDKYEEVDIVEKGKNYGWRIMEGNHCYNPSSNCNTKGLTFPIDEYDHSLGKCIIGGYVYRGSQYHDMQGNYIFGDWTGKIFILFKSAASGNWERWPLTIHNAPDDFSINSFGEDEAGELYLCSQTSVGPYKIGSVYRLEFK